MVLTAFTLSEDYWVALEIEGGDLEVLYNHLLEVETPLSPHELLQILIKDRLQREQKAAKEKQSEGGKTYLPKEDYQVGEMLVFPAFDLQVGTVKGTREARSYEDTSFKVIDVEFEDGTTKEFASGLAEHKLNNPIEVDDSDPLLSPTAILDTYGESLEERLVEELQTNEDFVYIAGSWFPRALLVDVTVGNLNLAEAFLDMEGGGPLSTEKLLEQVDLPSGVNTKLAEFSLDLAMQEDERFDEVGSTGMVSWYLKRLEPREVLETPVFLRYSPIEFDRSTLSEEMLNLEKRLDDEFSPLDEEEDEVNECEINLIFPHWRVGSLPLTPRLAKLFPSAYESPRVQLTLVDGDTGETFPGWVVRLEKYVYGLREWYLARGLHPGSKIFLSRGKNPGEVVVNTQAHRSNKEWVRTALVGADGGVVYATLKQTVEAAFDDWMMVYMPEEIGPLDQAWEAKAKKPPAFEQVVADTLRELAKLNPQAHVHAAELYSAVNVVFRCPPGPILGLLATRSWFAHVGDLHFRFEDSEK
jgi:hypothetical protein